MRSKCSKSLLEFANIRGLNSNLNAVHQHLQACRPIILGLSETQICNPLSDNHLTCPGYDLYSNFCPKGGVCIFVRSDCRASRLSHFDVSCRDFQILWIKLHIDNSCCVVGMVYRSPHCSSDDRFFSMLNDVVESSLSSTPNAEIVLMGDFNVHNSDWLPSSRITDSAGSELERFCVLNNFEQLVKGPTRIPDRAGDFASTLDLFLSTNADSYLDSVISAPIGSSDHNLISLFRPSQSNKSGRPLKRCLWKFQKADWDGFRDFLASFPWTDWLRSCDASESADRITEILQLGMACFIPHSHSPGGKNSPKWFSPECAVAVKEKNLSFKTLKSDPSLDNLEAYRVSRNSCSVIIDAAKKDFVKRTAMKLSACPSGSRAFWSLSKAICSNFSSSSFPPLTDSNGTSVTDSFEKANIFADTFALNSTLPGVVRPPLTPSVPDSTMRSFRISTRAVRRQLQLLDPSKATGPDNIPAIVLIRCAPELAPVLSRLFRLCISSGVCPSAWKSAHVVPIPKKGSRSDPSNYRPIAITSILCKVLESLISEALLAFLKSKNLLNDRQYGFQKSRSTGDLLSYVTNKWAQVLDQFGETIAVALDISKAFDRVWHDGLIHKLRCLGIDLPIISWIEDFLTNRSIAVRVDGVLSNFRSINSGVPQGCVLSPLLFLIYINDLLSCSHNEIHSFADDSTLHSSISYTSQLKCTRNLITDRANQATSLNSDIAAILDWGTFNRVTFNDKKTQVVQISLKRRDNSPSLSMSGCPLSTSRNVSMLGISISENLSWKNHIHNIARNASRRLGILFRSRQYFSSSQLLTLYKSQVRPVMEYCSHIWGGAPSSDLLLLDRIQKKAVRLIDDPNLTNSLPSLAHRRAVSSLALFYRYYHGRCSDELTAVVPKPKSFSRSTRSTSLTNPYVVSIPRCRTEVYKSSFFPRTALLWNKVPLHCFPLQYDLQQFKVQVNRLPLSTMT